LIAALLGHLDATAKAAYFSLVDGRESKAAEAVPPSERAAA
jgi:hypothetical protein